MNKKIFDRFYQKNKRGIYLFGLSLVVLFGCGAYGFHLIAGEDQTVKEIVVFPTSKESTNTPMTMQIITQQLKIKPTITSLPTPIITSQEETSIIITKRQEDTVAISIPDTTIATTTPETILLPTSTLIPTPIPTPILIETTETAAATTVVYLPDQGLGYYNNEKAAEILCLTNQERSAVGLPALTWDNELEASAAIRAAEITILWSHTRPGGLDWWTAGSQKQLGENLATGQNTAQQTIEDWMASEGHATNILNGNFTQMGAACYILDREYYWTQHFA